MDIRDYGTYNIGRETDEDYLWQWQTSWGKLLIVITVAEKLRKITYNSGRQAEEDYRYL